ncbi:MAG: MBOAT family protein [Alistipes sp.]|nr:MBOAT family protein [Candidatus Alistipes equi]
MIFNSLEYAIFLPVVFLIYWKILNRNLFLQNLFIVAVSYFFYGWWNWKFLILIAFTSLCSFLTGIIIDRFRFRHTLIKWIGASNILINISILALFKYYDFFVKSFAEKFLDGNTEGLLLNIILPVGISFYTFQALSYGIDVYREKIKATRNIVEFFAFVSFFPQLVAGPIERATNLLPQFQKRRTFDLALAQDGIRQILWGLFKKIAVADGCAVVVNEVFASYQTQSGSSLFIAIILFTIQIYGDFSGYSDIAIGSSKLFGVRLMRNFNYPYFSRDIAELWRRWHISLTTWFRDYVYIPLGGSRGSKARVIRNTLIIFTISGMWHGANWTFICWGLFNALLFIPLIILGKNRRFRDTVASGKLFPSPVEALRIIQTFLLFALAFILFRSPTIYDAWNYFIGLFHWETFTFIYKFFDISRANILAFVIGFMFLVEWLQREREHGLSLSFTKRKWLKILVEVVMIWLIFLFRARETGEFIYFQF